MGAAVTRGLQQRGITVACLDLQRGGPADIELECDVSDEASLRQSVDDAAEQLGSVDYAYVNAGVAGAGPLLEMPITEWDRVMGVNLRGAFMTVQACGRKMRDAGAGGSIVLTASAAAVVTDIGVVHYSVAKIGVTQIARVAARELAYYGIRVNAVAPGLTRTGLIAGTELMPGYHEHVAEITPLGRLGEPEDIAEAVLALFGLPWVTGQTLVVDGGLTLVSSTDVPGVTAATLAAWSDTA
jgi:NAD(P)-dependent dehydrogenase (short-subunit alcohol dehydrogenase family)